MTVRPCCEGAIVTPLGAERDVNVDAERSRLRLSRTGLDHYSIPNRIGPFSHRPKRSKALWWAGYVWTRLPGDRRQHPASRPTCEMTKIDASTILTRSMAGRGWFIPASSRQSSIPGPAGPRDSTSSKPRDRKRSAAGVAQFSSPVTARAATSSRSCSSFVAPSRSRTRSSVR